MLQVKPLFWQCSGQQLNFIQMGTFNTNKGQLNEKQLFSILEWGSYAANRDYGITHEQLLSIGIGNDAMKKKYELEQKGIYEN